MTPFFSIIVPVYQAEAYLRQCVDSILGQTYGDFELFLVDDGSPDSCGAICDAYAAKDARVHAVHQENAGPAAARRNGLFQATGAYVCFVDADDWVVETWLEVIKGHIDANGAPDMVLFDLSRDVGEPEQPIFAEEGLYDKARMEKKLYPYMLFDLKRKPFGAQLVPGYLCTKVSRRELITAHYLTDERITVYEDAAMSYECLYHADSVYITRQRLYVYRRQEVSNLKHYRSGFFRETRHMFDYVSAHLVAKDPLFSPQLCGFAMYNIIIRGIAEEYSHAGRFFPAARKVAAELKATGFVRDLHFTGLPLYIQLFLMVLKLRLYYLAVLMVKLRM